MILKVIIEAVESTIHDLWNMVKSFTMMIVIIGIPMFASVAVCLALTLAFPNAHGIIPRLIGNGLALCTVGAILILFYLWIKIPYAKIITKAEKIASQDVPVAARLRVVLDRFHEDCYVNNQELYGDVCMMSRLIDAHEEGTA